MSGINNMIRRVRPSLLVLIFASCFLSAFCSTLLAKNPEIPPCNGNEEVDTLCSLPLTDVHPTQFSVGMIHVLCNRAKLENKSFKKLQKFLHKKKNRLPAIISPDKKFYITDGHHFCSALFLSRTDEWVGREQRIVIQVIRNDNQSLLTFDAFWKKMLATKRVFPFDEKGAFVKDFGSKLSAINVGQLKDDPYRTLSTWVREGCGYIKHSEKACVALNAAAGLTDSPPFIEQYWAMYLQAMLERENIINIEQLWHLYPEALNAALNKNKTDTFFSELGLPPEEYGQNQTGNHLKLQRRKAGCVTRKNTDN